MLDALELPWPFLLPCLQHRAPPFAAPVGTSPPFSTMCSAKAPQVFQHRTRGSSTTPSPFSGGSFPSWF